MLGLATRLLSGAHFRSFALDAVNKIKDSIKSFEFIFTTFAEATFVTHIVQKVIKFTAKCVSKN
mgnify:FL=1